MKLIRSNLTKLETQVIWKVGEQLQRKICFKSHDLLTRSIYTSEIVNQNRPSTEYSNIPTDDDDNDDDNNVIKFQKHTKTETSGQKEKSHTHKHNGDSFKEHTFKKITSAIQTPIREISVAIVLQNQAINMQRVSPFIRQKYTEL
jgi:hypothetical protein